MANQRLKATKATIHLGNIPLNVYRDLDGSYKLHVESVTEIIGKEKRDLVYFIEFLKKNSPKILPYKDYNIVHAETVLVEGEEKFIKPIPIALATSYWQYEAFKGNPKAQALARASMIESIERRADQAFGDQRTEIEYNQRFQETWESVLEENRQDIIDRRTLADDLYYPLDIN
jgi:hypothetical protein